MVKILSNSGDSLADMYGVQGSVAGIEQLETRDLAIVHEMGATLFSERFATDVRRLASGDVLQNTDIDIVITNLPGTPARLLAIAVITDDATRLSRAAVMVRDPSGSVAGRECPIWQWDATNFTAVEMVDTDDATPQVYSLLRATFEATFVPNFIGGAQQQPSMMSAIAFRARTNGFGAGTVFCRALLYLALPRPHRAGSGSSSFGLPIPSW